MVTWSLARQKILYCSVANAKTTYGHFRKSSKGKLGTWQRLRLSGRLKRRHHMILRVSFAIIIRDVWKYEGNRPRIFVDLRNKWCKSATVHKSQSSSLWWIGISAYIADACLKKPPYFRPPFVLFGWSSPRIFRIGPFSRLVRGERESSVDVWMTWLFLSPSSWSNSPTTRRCWDAHSWTQPFWQWHLYSKVIGHLVPLDDFLDWRMVPLPLGLGQQRFMSFLLNI